MSMGQVMCMSRAFFLEFCGSVVDRMKGERRGGKVELCRESRVGRDAFQLSPKQEGGPSLLSLFPQIQMINLSRLRNS
jgi:hypothetical protein